MRRNILTTVVLFLTGAVASWGQSIEITPFVGYKFGGSVPVQSDKIDVNKIEFDDSISAGINAGFNFTEHSVKTAPKSLDLSCGSELT